MQKTFCDYCGDEMDGELRNLNGIRIVTGYALYSLDREKTHEKLRNSLRLNAPEDTCFECFRKILLKDMGLDDERLSFY
jgi:hypothetical protein